MRKYHGMVNYDTSTAKARQAIMSTSCLHLVSISPHPLNKKNKTYRHGILKQLHRSKGKFFSSILCRAKWNYSERNHERCKETGYRTGGDCSVHISIQKALRFLKTIYKPVSEMVLPFCANQNFVNPYRQI